MADFELKISMDTRGLERFDKAMRDQVPFATAVALTRTAAQASDKVKAELGGHFILRNQYTKNSIRFERAQKRDWPEPKAIVGSISPYMGIQEAGGDKAPRTKAFAIPKGIRRQITSLVPRAKWPGALLQGQMSIPMGGRLKGSKLGARNKPKPFLLRERDGVGVYVRIGKSRKLKRLYRLTHETLRVKGRHWLSLPVTEVVTGNLFNNFKKALDEAVRAPG